MSICNTAILGENINLELILPRLAREGGFDCISAIQFQSLEEVFNGEWSLNLIAPDMPFHKYENNELFKKYINDYLIYKSKRIFTNPSPKQISQFVEHEMQVKILITKCHF